MYLILPFNVPVFVNIMGVNALKFSPNNKLLLFVTVSDMGK